MNPLRLRLENVGRFPSLDVDFPAGCVAVTGPNGAGKSTLLNAIELALFADGSRDLAPCLSPWADRLQVELEFEHAGETYRVRQGYKVGSGGRGTSTVDFEQLGPGWHIEPDEQGEPLQVQSHPEWEPISRENADATRALIVETLGLSRRTFRASSFLAQGDAAAFPEASPADRKAILGEILDPRGLWPKLAETVKVRARSIDSTLTGDQSRIADRELVVAGIPDLEEAELLAAGDVAEATGDLSIADASLTEAQAAAAANAAAYERHRAADQAVTAAQAVETGARTALAAAKGQADVLEPARAKLEELAALAATVADLETRIEAQRTAVLEASEARRLKTEAGTAADRQRAQVTRLLADRFALTTRRDATAERLAHLTAAEDGTERCDRCEQLLGAEARDAAVKSLQGELDAFVDETVAADTAIDEAQAVLEDLDHTHKAIELPEIPQTQGDLDGQLLIARSAAESRQAVAVKIEQYETEAMRLPTLTQALEAAMRDVTAKDALLAQAAEEMGDNVALDHAVREANLAVATARNALTAFQSGHARASERLTLARAAETELAEIRSRTETAQQQLDLLKLAERAYGRDGIPVLLVENVIPQIEAEANRILEQMPTADGVVFTVELRTQAANKSNANIRETLDILASDPDGDRPYETFSGGERARLNIALRIALARLLAGRRRAESRLLAIDELEYLDALGQEQLVDVVRSVSGDFDIVLIVSHADVVRDAFDSVITIAKSDGVSAVAGTREPAAVMA